MKKSIAEISLRLKEKSEMYCKSQSVHNDMTAKLLQKILQEKLDEHFHNKNVTCMADELSLLLSSGILKLCGKNHNMSSDCEKTENNMHAQETLECRYNELVHLVPNLSLDDKYALFDILSKSLESAFTFIERKCSPGKRLVGITKLM